MRPTVICSLLTLTFFAPGRPAAAQAIEPNAARPPIAKKVPKEVAIHGDRYLDDYFWLREKANPEVIAHLEAENAYTDAVMRPTQALRAKLFDEMLGRIRQTDLEVPIRLDDFEYYTRTEQGRQYPIRCRRRLAARAAEEILLDLDELTQGHDFLSLGAFAVSDDGNLLAYSIDTTGSQEYTLYVKDLRTGRLLPDRVERVGRVQWAADNRTLFYIVEDAAKRPYRLYRHTLGEADDHLLYEEEDELYRLLMHRSRDRKYLFLTSLCVNGTEVRYLPSDRPAEGPRVILPREVAHAYHADHRDGRFYLRTDKGPSSPEFHVVSAPVDDPRPENWREVVPVRAGVRIQRFDVFAHHGVVVSWRDGNALLEVVDLRDGTMHPIEFPEPVYTATSDPETNPDFDSTTYRFEYQSLVTPRAVYDYDMNARTLRLLKQTEVVGGYDPARYAEERIEARAPDGARIPISLAYNKGVPRDGSAPLLLVGYGAYGLPMNPTFLTDRLSLLDRGVIYAIAHVRGGGDKGRVWHDQGRMFAKWNTFADFIAAAEHLIGRKYTARDRLAIQGRSAGGLLIGVVVNLRPDLFRVALLDVPFVDAVNSMLDASLPLTAQEYLEWGNPRRKVEYEFLKSYCPYTNLAPGDYPAILVRGSLNDSQVMFWEPAKYVAKLRPLKTDGDALLLKVNMTGGHSGSSGRYETLKETAFLYAFLLDQLGLHD